MKRGRTLIITEFDGTQASFDKLPVGTIYINPQNGETRVKLANEIWWKNEI